MKEFNLNDVASQRGRIALVTGSNTGLGFETAKMLAAKDAHVIMAVRDTVKGNAALENILAEYPGATIEIMPVDLSSLASVRDLANTYLSTYNHLDLLINNAGIMIPPYSKTKDGFESQIGVNYLSHFLLTALLFKTIDNTPGSRIVSLASNAHIKGYINFDDLNWEKGYYALKAYRQSKLACLIFAIELDRRIRKSESGTLSVAAHPGLSVTDLVRHIPKWVMTLGKPITALLTHSPENGAMPILYAALADDVKGGEYFGPQGYKEWTGKPGRAESTALANDKNIAGRLWELSENLTGIKFSI